MTPAAIQMKAKEFLALPAEALPSVAFAAEDTDLEDSVAWDILRAAAAGKIGRLRSYGPIRLVADRDGWRHGVLLK